MVFSREQKGNEDEGEADAEAEAEGEAEAEAEAEDEDEDEDEHEDEHEHIHEDEHEQPVIEAPASTVVLRYPAFFPATVRTWINTNIRLKSLVDGTMKG